MMISFSIYFQCAMPFLYDDYLTNIKTEINELETLFN